MPDTQPTAAGGQCSPGGSRPFADRFDPPAQLDDLDSQHLQAWSEEISALLDQEIQHAESPIPQFYNPLKTATAADQQTKTICWVAFPNKVAVNAPSDDARWQQADASRGVQDEYCEWSVTRNAAGKITRVTFTCEGPEYWDFLARTDRQKTLDLYRTFVNPAVTMNDLYPNGGAYNPHNRFNNSTTNGAMHLIQVNNTLGAEIDIVARATVRRHRDGRDLTGEEELIACSGYGDADRNSDPHIGGEVNALARLLADVTVANPVGLYIDSFNPSSAWATPDRSDPKDYWSIVRGPADMGVRAVYEVPAAKGFVVGDITINGRTIDFGSQITDFIRIKVTGLACRFSQSRAQPLTNCPGRRGASPAAGLAAHQAAGSGAHARTR
jgi:hypothetical protein